MKSFFFIIILMIHTMVYAQNYELVKNGDVTLNTAIYSGEKEETIILLHGGPGVPDNMLEVVNTLKDDFGIITFEQRGTGFSICDGCSYSMEEYISDIDAIAKHYNISEFHLFGHSWGGLYAQIYASENPHKIKSLFLCSPSSGTNDLWKITEKEVMQFNKQTSTNMEWIKMGWNSFLGMMGSDKAYRKLFKQVFVNYHSDYNEIAVNEGILKKIHSEPINKTRKEIIKYKPLGMMTDSTYPVMITYGDNDIYGKSRNMLIERYPNANIEVLKNCGHIPWKHKLNDFEAVLNRFYNKSN